MSKKKGDAHGAYVKDQIIKYRISKVEKDLILKVISESYLLKGLSLSLAIRRFVKSGLIQFAPMNLLEKVKDTIQ